MCGRRNLSCCRPRIQPSRPPCRLHCRRSRLPPCFPPCFPPWPHRPRSRSRWLWNYCHRGRFPPRPRVRCGRDHAPSVGPVGAGRLDLQGCETSPQVGEVSHRTPPPSTPACFNFEGRVPKKAPGLAPTPTGARSTSARVHPRQCEGKVAGTHFGARGRIRTCGLRLRRPTLYPAELRARLGARDVPEAAGWRNRLKRPEFLLVWPELWVMLES